MVEPGEQQNVHLRTRFAHYFNPLQLTGHILYVEQNSDDHIRAVLFNRMALPEEARASLNKNSKNILIQMRTGLRRWRNPPGGFGAPSMFETPPDHLLRPEYYRNRMRGGRSIRTKQTRKSRKNSKSQKNSKTRKTRKTRKSRKSRK